MGPVLLSGLVRHQDQHREQQCRKQRPRDLGGAAADDAAGRGGSHAHAQRGDDNGGLDDGEDSDDEPKAKGVHQGKGNEPAPVVAADNRISRGARYKRERSRSRFGSQPFTARARLLLDEARFGVERGPGEPEVVGVNYRR